MFKKGLEYHSARCKIGVPIHGRGDKIRAIIGTVIKIGKKRLKKILK
jgi:hypothetical protein